MTEPIKPAGWLVLDPEGGYEYGCMDPDYGRDFCHDYIKDAQESDNPRARKWVVRESFSRDQVEQNTADARSLASKWESLFSAQVQLTEAARHRADKAGAERDEARAEVERLRAALETAEYALRSRGYRKSCEISACNCGDQWSHGGNAEARLRELSSELHGSPVDMNGKTLLAGLSELVERTEKAEAEIERLTTLRSASEWRDDDGDVLWWRMPIQEAPYVGSPLECGWFEDFYTHWTPLPKVKEPK